MSQERIQDFVNSLASTLCKKFSLKEDETLPLDSFCNELIKFSRHIEDYILEDIFKMPAQLLNLEELFLGFLSSVCSEICGLNEPAEAKFFLLCAFLTIITTLSFALPCYRLVSNVKMILALKLKTKLVLDDDVINGFETLEGHCPKLLKNRIWIRSRLRRMRGFIQDALGDICNRLEKQPDIASHLKMVKDMKIQESAKGAESSESEECPFCKFRCKRDLERLLN